MNFSQLLYVKEIVNCGNFSKAAQQLYVTQPTISQQISALEEELGVKLFKRQLKQAVLTSAGEDFFQSAVILLDEYNKMRVSMDEHARKERGRLHLGTIWDMDILGINNLIEYFLQQSLGYSLNLVINDSITLQRKLVAKELDAIITIVVDDATFPSGFSIHKLRAQEMVAILPIDNPLSKYETLSFADLKDHPLVLPDENSISCKYIYSEFKRLGVTPNVVCECLPFHTSLQLASSGVGICLTTAPTNIVVPSDAKYAICPMRWLPPKKMFNLVYITPNDSTENPVLQRFTSFVQKWASELIISELHL